MTLVVERLLKGKDSIPVTVWDREGIPLSGEQCCRKKNKTENKPPQRLLHNDGNGKDSPDLLYHQVFHWIISGKKDVGLININESTVQKDGVIQK